MQEREQYELVCAPAFKRLEDVARTHDEKLDQIIAMLRGSNGDGGILGRLRAVETAVSQHGKVVESHDVALYGGCGKDDTGLIDDCRELRRRAARTDKVAWTAISAAIVQAVVWIKSMLLGG